MPNKRVTLADAPPHEAMGHSSVELLLDHDRRPGHRLIPMPVIERGSIRTPAG